MALSPAPGAVDQVVVPHPTTVQKTVQRRSSSEDKKSDDNDSDPQDSEVMARWRKQTTPKPTQSIPMMVLVFRLALSPTRTVYTRKTMTLRWMTSTSQITGSTIFAYFGTNCDVSRWARDSCLEILHPTDLTYHPIRLTPGAKPHSVHGQKTWPPDKEYWLHFHAGAEKLKWANREPEEDAILQGRIYEHTQSVNGRNRDQARNSTFLYADVKRGYFAVLLNPEDRHVSAAPSFNPRGCPRDLALTASQ
ncbi:hypothetical protein VTN96DRAFT_5541 [Rasamsonia emersonii]